MENRLRDEIDRRRQEVVIDLVGHEENFEYYRLKGMHDAFIDLLSFIDSLPEESGRTLFEEIAYPGSFGEFVAGLNPPPKIPEMKKDEDLKEAAEKYANKYYADNGYSPFPNTEKAASSSGFIAGAEWMKKNAGKGYDSRDMYEAYEQGRAEQKEQMMKEAVEVEVVSDLHNVCYIRSMSKIPDGLRFGDKMKLIIVKEGEK